MPSKPCYLELTQESYSATLVGDSSDPVVPKAALRVRLCTSNANALDSALCEDFSAEQDLDIQIVNGQAAAMEDQIVLWQSLDTGVGTVDTGPYTEVGAHNVFGAVCQYGDFACRFAWQYCEVSVPDPGETLAAPQ